MSGCLKLLAFSHILSGQLCESSLKMPALSHVLSGKLRESVPLLANFSSAHGGPEGCVFSQGATASRKQVPAQLHDQNSTEEGAGQVCAEDPQEEGHETKC